MTRLNNGKWEYYETTDDIQHGRRQSPLPQHQETNLRGQEPGYFYWKLHMLVNSEKTKF